MTVETTSFLSGAKITSNGSEKSAKFLKNHKNLIIFLFAIILLLFCVSASVLQIWIMNRINGLQGELASSWEEIDQQKIEIKQLVREVTELRENVNEMKKNMGFDDDLFDDLDEFDKKYDQDDIKDEIDLDENSSIDDDKIKFDDVGEEDEDDESYENGQSGSGYGENYDLDDDEYDTDSLGSTVTTSEKEDDNNIYKDMIKTRKTRSITDVTNQGIPILEEPYALRRNRTRNERLPMNIILPNGRDSQNPKLRLTWDSNRKHLSSSRREQLDRHVNRIHNTRHQHNLQDSKNRFAFAAAPVHHSFESYGKKTDDAIPSSPPSIQTRRSRVMHVEDKTKAFRQVVRKDQLDRLQEVRKAPEQWTNQQNVNARRRALNPIRRHPELKNGKRMKITAVHYEGDASVHRVGHHQNQGNNKVKLDRNEYMHWVPASWTDSHGMDRFFLMDNSGVLTVKDHGVFLIYAQVVYSNDHDNNGFRIELNDRIKYQCLTMSHATTHVTRTNSCYTSGLIHLKHGDRIQLRDIGNHRSVMLEPSKSFFGLIKINLMPMSESSEVEAFNAEK